MYLRVDGGVEWHKVRWIVSFVLFEHRYFGTELRFREYEIWYVLGGLGDLHMVIRRGAFWCRLPREVQCRWLTVDVHVPC